MAETRTVLENINGEWIADLTEEMVRVPSVTMDEAAICIYYEQQLRELGLEVDVREVTPDGELAWEILFAVDEWTFQIGHMTLLDDLYALNEGGLPVR